MNTYRHIFILLLLFSLFNVSCARSSKLQMHLGQGKSYSQKVHIVSNMRLPIGVRNADLKDTEMLLDYKVLEVDSQGVAKVEVTINSIRASMNSLGKKFAYDSQAKPKKTASEDEKQASHQEKFTKSFAGIAGSKYKALVNVDAKVLQLIDVDESIEKVRSGKVYGMFGGDQIAMVLSNANLREYVSAGLFDGIKGGQLLKGQTVEVEVPIEVPRTRMVTGKKTYSLKNVKAVKNDDGKDKDVKEYPKGATVVSYKYGQIGKVDTPSKDKPRMMRDKKRYGMYVVEIFGEGEIVFTSNGRFYKLQENLAVQVRPGRPTGKAKTKKKRKNKIYYIVEKTIEHVI